MRMENDLISRQAAIDAAIEAADEWDGGYNLEREQIIRKSLQGLPSAHPERKKGKWIENSLDNFRKYEVVCSECGSRYIGNYDAYDEPYDFNFCPNCGADMRGEQAE